MRMFLLCLRNPRCWGGSPIGTGLFLAALLAGLIATPPARASTIETILEPFTGGPASVLVSITDEDNGLNDGELLVQAHVLDGGAIRGVFLDLMDTSALSGIQARGSHVTGFETGDVINLGGGSNLQGGGSPCPCDLAVEIGTPGRSGDFLQTTALILSSSRGPIDISLFFEQNVGVRLSPESSKLGGVFPVPEPSTAMLVGLGLSGLGLAGRNLRRV